MTAEPTTLRNLMADLNEENLLSLVKERLTAGESPMAIVEVCREGMQDVGERFARGDSHENTSPPDASSP